MQMQKGQSIIEFLVAIALAAILLPALITGQIASREGKAQQNQRLDAITLLQETQDALRIIRERGWSYISSNGTYHPEESGSTWSLASDSETVRGFGRSVVISDVYRNSNGDIVSSGGTIDPSTKKAVITVSWTTPIPYSVSSTSYLTRYLNNTAYTQTTENDFNSGLTHYTKITNTAGGEVTLSTLGQGNWCSPSEYISETLTLPKQGNAIAAREGSAFIGTGDGTAGTTFVKVNINNPPQPTPPEATVSGSYSSNYKTNAVFSDGNYAYLATDDLNQQVIILDLTQPPPYQQIGYVYIPPFGNPSLGHPANGVYVLNNILYVTSGIKLFTYDITTKTGAHTTPLDSISMFIGIGSEPTARQVVVKGDYAYVATGNTLFGLQKINVLNSNGNIKRVVGVSNLTWRQESQGLAINPTGSRAYVAFDNGYASSGYYFAKGFFIVDTSTADPPSWWPLPVYYSIRGYYNAGDTDPKGMAVVSGNNAIVVGTNGAEQYQVISIQNEANPVRCGGYTVPSGIYGISTVSELDGDAYSYIITGEARDQFKIIMGGTGGGGYANQGNFESGTFDPGFEANYNHFTANFTQPPQTTVRFQIAVSDAVSGNCLGSTYQFVGPDGTSGTYFTANGIIPTDHDGLNFENPGRCFRYKVYYTSSDLVQTPVLDDFTVNYSP